MTFHSILCSTLLVASAASVMSQTPARKGHRPEAIQSEESIRQQSIALLKGGLTKAVRQASASTLNVDAIAAELLKNHRIIGLGEATHGTSEIFSMRTEFLKAMVRQGARVLVLEAPVTRAHFLDDFVCHRAAGNPSILAVMKQAKFYRVWQVPEVGAMFEWIREFNADHAEEPVRIYGMDPNLADLDRVIQILDGKAPGFDPAAARAKDAAYFDAVDRLGEAIDPVVKAIPGIEAHRVFQGRLNEAMALREAVASAPLASEVRTEANRHLRAVEQACVMDGLWMAHWAALFPSFDAIFKFDSEGNLRDQHMAANFILLDKEVLQRKKRAILWAHSGHLTRRPLSVPSTGTHFLPVGSHISQQYGDQYHVIHFTAYSGSTRAYPVEWPGPNDRLQPVGFTCPDESMEGLIRAAGAKGPTYLPTKSLPMRDLRLRFLAIGATHVDKGLDGIFEGSIGTFDSVFFIPEGHASKGLVEPVNP